MPETMPEHPGRVRALVAIHNIMVSLDHAGMVADIHSHKDNRTWIAEQLEDVVSRVCPHIPNPWEETDD